MPAFNADSRDSPRAHRWETIGAARILRRQPLVSRASAFFSTLARREPHGLGLPGLVGRLSERWHGADIAPTPGRRASPSAHRVLDAAWASGVR